MSSSEEAVSGKRRSGRREKDGGVLAEEGIPGGLGIESAAKKPPSKRSSRSEEKSVRGMSPDRPFAGSSRLRDLPARTVSRYAQRSTKSTLQREDSFASPLPAIDQANAFIRDSAIFNKPLDKLGIDSQDDEDDDNLALPSPPRRHNTLRNRSPQPESHSYFVPNSDSSQDMHSQARLTPELQLRSQSPLSADTQGSDIQQGQVPDSGYALFVVCHRCSAC